MARQFARRFRRGGFVALTIALSACATQPAPPLMSPIQIAKSYGYSEVPLGDNRYEISYVGPYQRGARLSDGPRQAGAAERAQAFDFAVWRAAQIALAQGYVGFRVSNVRSNVNTVIDSYADPFYRPWYGPGIHPYSRPWEPPYWGPYGGPSPYAYRQAEITIEATLLHDPGPGDYDAKDIVDQLRRTYPGAEGTSDPALLNRS